MCSLDDLLEMLLLHEAKKLMQKLMQRQILSCMDFDELIAGDVILDDLSKR